MKYISWQYMCLFIYAQCLGRSCKETVLSCRLSYPLKITCLQVNLLDINFVLILDSESGVGSGLTLSVVKYMYVVSYPCTCTCYNINFVLILGSE